MRHISELAPARDDRAGLVGHTGYGKTTAAYYILNLKPYVGVFDTKGLLGWCNKCRLWKEHAASCENFGRREWWEYERFDTLSKFVESDNPRIIYAPKREELSDESYHYAWFEWLYQRENTQGYVDETFAVTQNQRMPESFFACLTRGRELSVSILYGMQRPTLVPQTILSQTDKFYVFYIQMPQDRKKMAELIPTDPDTIRDLRKGDFLYYQDGSRTVTGPHRLNLEGGSSHGGNNGRQRPGGASRASEPATAQ